jgi:hypothetical protein
MSIDKLTDEQFLELVNQFTPKDEVAQPISYEEAQLKNAQQMVDNFTSLLKNCPDTEPKLRVYYEDLIRQYQKIIDQPIKQHSRDEMIDIMNSLSKAEDFHLLPMPLSYVEILAKENADKLDELKKIKYMDKQVKEKDANKRLQNYKDYIYDKIDRKKLDNKYKNK